jgi:hypothetical protein
MRNKASQYTSDNADGSVTITLSRPFDVNGEKLTALTMREPTVNDQLIAAEVKGTETDKDVQYFSSLTGVAPSDLSRLPIRDYTRIAAAFTKFLSKVSEGADNVEGDGFTTITLSRPFDVKGEKLSTLTMREPTVGDQLVAAQSKGTETSKELQYFSNLCGVATVDLRRLPVCDYTRIAAAFSNFLD